VKSIDGTPLHVATGDATTFEPFRKRAHERFEALLPEHIERHAWDAGRLRSFQEERLRALL